MGFLSPTICISSPGDHCGRYRFGLQEGQAVQHKAQAHSGGRSGRESKKASTQTLPFFWLAALTTFWVSWELKPVILMQEGEKPHCSQGVSCSQDAVHGQPSV